MSFVTVIVDTLENVVNNVLQAISATRCLRQDVPLAQFPSAMLMELKELCQTVAASVDVMSLVHVVINAHLALTI